MKKLAIIGRLLALPFILGLTIIGGIVLLIRMNVTFLKNGGEFIPYYNKDENKQINDIYQLLLKERLWVGTLGLYSI